MARNRNHRRGMPQFQGSHIPCRAQLESRAERCLYRQRHTDFWLQGKCQGQRPEHIRGSQRPLSGSTKRRCVCVHGRASRWGCLLWNGRLPAERKTDVYSCKASTEIHYRGGWDHTLFCDHELAWWQLFHQGGHDTRARCMPEYFKPCAAHCKAYMDDKAYLKHHGADWRRTDYPAVCGAVHAGNGKRRGRAVP